ncbi:hypothetical protein JST99_05485 [Candidatus Dependentiae bacterium]|nr:hypothetical protein [Candidatus Dependentiae bacterium]MCC7414999.1 hypothetical protein [Campylobacterota bacterium]
MQCIQNYLFTMILSLSVLVTQLARACPTCTGSLEADTPPLFSKEYEKQYTLYEDGMLEIPAIQKDYHEAH